MVNKETPALPALVLCGSQYSYMYCMHVAGITILLSLSVFQLIVAEMVPSTSMAVPLVGRS